LIKLPLDVIHGLIHYINSNGVVKSIKSIVLCNSSSSFFGACLIQRVINQKETIQVYFLDMYLLKVFNKMQVSNNTIYIVNFNYIDGLVLQERFWPVNVTIPFSALFKRQSNHLITTHLHGIKSIESNNTNYLLPIGISLKEYYSLFIKNIIKIIINLQYLHNEGSLFKNVTLEEIFSIGQQLKSIENNYPIKQFKYIPNKRNYVCVCSEKIINIKDCHKIR
jgi:hypothetical protein